MASVPFEFNCVRGAGFVMDPNQHKRVGYVLALDGFGSTNPTGLSPDLQVNVPYNSPGPAYGYHGLPIDKSNGATGIGTAHVVGVIEKFTWAGAVGDSINIEFWCSQENATHIKSLQQLTLKNTGIKQLSWWIANYDQETKLWFEESYPKTPAAITGTIAGGDNPELNVDLAGAPVKDGVDVMVYKVAISVVPAANQAYALAFANSENKPTVKAWGLVVGSLAADSL